MKTVWDSPNAVHKPAAVQAAPATQPSTQSIGRPRTLLLHIPGELAAQLDALVLQRGQQYLAQRQPSAPRYSNTKEENERAIAHYCYTYRGSWPHSLTR